MKKTFLALLFFGLWGPALLFADQVDRSYRLNALRSATGQSTTDNLYEARLSATYNRTATAERSAVARQDAAIRQENQIKQEAKLEAIYTTGFESKDLRQLQNETEASKTKSEEETASGLVDYRINASEKQYQIDEYQFLEKRAREEKELFEKEQAEKLGAKKATAKEGAETQEDGLVNNPFYFAEHKNAKLASGDYTGKKHEIIRRLMDDGFKYGYAKKIADATTSIEDLVVYMVEEEGYTYLEANNIANDIS